MIQGVSYFFFFLYFRATIFPELHGSFSALCSVVGVQSLSHVQLFMTPWTAALQAFLSFTISWSLLKLVSIELVIPSNHLILCHPFSSCPQSFQALWSFPASQLIISVARSFTLSTIFPMNTQS